MPVFRMYTAAQLEDIGRAVARRYPYRVQGRPFEVDIDRILTAKGITLLFKYGILSRHKVAGLAMVCGKVIVVDTNCYDNVNYEKMVRFTLAEEFAHTILHCSVARQRGVHDRATFRAFMDRIPEGDVHQAERNARKLAEAILMPEQDFIRRFHELKRELHADFADPDSTVISQLTHDFNLNLKPVVYRAANLGLIADSGVILNSSA